MVRSDEDAHAHADRVASYLADHKNFLSHGRRVGIEKLEQQEIRVVDMRKQPELHEAVRKLYFAVVWTFSISPAFKIIENSHGDAYIRLVRPQIVPILPQAQQGPIAGQRRQKVKKHR